MAKALALGADAVSIGVAALLALGCNRSRLPRAPTVEQVDVAADYRALGHRRRGTARTATPGRCPVGITTQDPELERRLDPDRGRRGGGQLPAGHSPWR